MNAAGSALLRTLVAAGHGELANRLAAIQPTSPAQALVLHAVRNAVDEQGLAAAHVVADRLLRALDGAPVALDLTDLQLASDTLAVLQRMEADDRSAVRDLLARVTASLTPETLALVASAILGLLVPRPS